MNIVIFDGVCNLCNATVLFLIKYDVQENLYFVSLQSETGKRYINEYAIPNNINSVVFIKQNQVFKKSDAIIEIVKLLKGWPRMLSYFSILPSRVRNVFYDLIAKNRYSIFGKKESCSIPNEAHKKRFLS